MLITHTIVNIKHSITLSCLCELSFCALTPPLCLSLVTSRRKCTKRVVLLDQTTGTVSSHNFMMYLTLGALPCPIYSLISTTLTRRTTSLEIAPKPLYIRLILRHRPLSLDILSTLSWPVPRATVFSPTCLSHISNLRSA